MEIIPALQRLGFGEYEARAYVALVGRSPLNGYEVAKASGVPRANVYGALERLVARRAVLRIDEPGGTRFAPVPPAELLPRLGGEYRDVAAEAARALEALGAAPDPEPVYNVRGAAALFDHARAALRGAARSVLVALWPPEATALAGDLAAAEGRGVAVTTLCMAACEERCGGCRGTVYRFRAAREDATRRLVVATDGEEIVVGNVGPGDDAQGVRTRAAMVVDACSGAVRGGIALAAVAADLGSDLETRLSPETRALIAAAAPAGEGDDFVDRLRALRVG